MMSVGGFIFSINDFDPYYCKHSNENDGEATWRWWNFVVNGEQPVEQKNEEGISVVEPVRHVATVNQGEWQVPFEDKVQVLEIWTCFNYYGDEIVDEARWFETKLLFLRVPSKAPNEPPIAVITEPSNGATFTTEDSVVFDGSASSDPEGKELTYRWTSNIQGLLSTEVTFSRGLREGTHIITLTVTDPEGATDSATITIYVIS